MKYILYVLGALALLVIGFFLLNAYIYNEKQAFTAEDYKDAEYIIEGTRVRLQDGVAETETAPGSASKVATRYFGNEVRSDLNDDGRDDVVFLLTQQSGGSGTFFYVVVALNTENGYVGSEAFFLGDRIAPQTTEMSRDPEETNVIVVNYADRKEGEPMSAQPSIGKSVWLTLDAVAMQLNEVAGNPADEPVIIGGDRDEHGCLIAAGYSFDERVGACTRAFELTPDIAAAARIAVEHVGAQYGLTVILFNSYEEPGAYDITLEHSGDAQTRETIYIRGGQVVPAP